MPDNNMMQTMGMAVNPNFDPTEYARQQQALAMGQALLQNSMQAPEGQMVSGHYVAPSWTQQLARVLNGYAGNKAATDANAYMMRTNIGNTQAMLNSLPGSNQGAMPAAGTPPGGAAPASPFSQVGYPQAPASSPGAASSAAGYSPSGMGQAGNNPFTRENVIQSMILNGFSPEAAKAFWARTAPAPTQDQINSRDPLIGQSVQNNLATQNMTEVQKMIRARQMVPDGSPQAQILDAAIAKSNYVAPVEVKQGNIAMDAISHQPFAYNPKVADGMAPTFSFQNGVTTPTGAQALPGYASGAADIAGAVKGAESANGIINVTGPNGAVVPTVAGPAAAAGAAQLGLPAPMRNNNPGALMPGGKLASYGSPEQGLAALDANLQSYGKSGVNTLSGVISKWAPPGQNNTQAYIKDVSQRLGISPNQHIDLSNPAVRQAVGTGIMLHENGVNGVFGQGQRPQIGQSQTGKELTTQGTTMYQSAVKEAQNNQQFHQALDEMWNLANSGKFGPGTGAIARFKAMLSNSGIDMSGAQTDQDVMKKMASFISSSQLGSAGGTGTDTQLNNILSGLPHGDMTNEAMKKVIPLLKSQLDVKQGRASVATTYAQQHPNDMSGMSQAMNQYNQLADPGTVSLGNAFASASKQGPQAVRALESKMMQQYGKSWPGIKQRVMQLDSMGAFQ